MTRPVKAGPGPAFSLAVNSAGPAEYSRAANPGATPGFYPAVKTKVALVSSPALNPGATPGFYPGPYNGALGRRRAPCRGQRGARRPTPRPALYRATGARHSADSRFSNVTKPTAPRTIICVQNNESADSRFTRASKPT